MYQFMAEAEHQLDWGLCGDTCADCARLRVVEGLIRLFDEPEDAAMSLAIMRDSQQNRCARCEKERR
jgi:hypothetical protein